MANKFVVEFPQGEADKALIEAITELQSVEHRIRSIGGNLVEIGATSTAVRAMLHAAKIREAREILSDYMVAEGWKK